MATEERKSSARVGIDSCLRRPSVAPRASSMAVTLAKQLSLVQQKRLQWAREREELASLCAPWGFHPKESTDSFRTSIRTQYVSTSQLHDIVRDSVQETILGRQRQRSPSLPPICRPPSDLVQTTDATVAREEEGDTSGYASEGCATDCGRQVAMWPSSQNRGYASPESVASTPSCRWSGTGSGTDEASRLRWGDRGVGVGHLWEPSMGEPDGRLPQVTSADTPSWLERGLRRLGVGAGSTTVSESGGAQVLILNHDSSSGPTSPISVQSHQHRTYILGQNVHLEPEELMEREIKRQKALEHQKAIRQQLEERDRRRKEDRERRILEEQLEEERVRRDQELEAQRLREEQRRQREKEEKDARRAQAIREALEEAERRALLERPSRLRIKKQQRQQQLQEAEDEDAEECRMCDKSNANTPRRQQHPADLPPPPPSPPLPLPAALRATLEAGPICTTESLPVVAAEGVAVMLDSVGVSSPGLQLALLVPQQPSRKDTSTQTEVGLRGKSRKKSASLERPRREGRLPLRSRSRSQSQPRGPLPLEERPKWGVNRPGHAYVKQSDRDPHYQRRQQRGQQRQPHGHGRRNNNALSSDENSRSPSPSAASVSGKTTMASRRRGGVSLLDLRPHLAKHHRHQNNNNNAAAGIIGNIANGNGGQRLLNRRDQEDKPTRSICGEDLWTSVRPVVTQLTSLRQCLLLKHQEWETPRSQTPFSEKSWNS